MTPDERIQTALTIAVYYSGAKRPEHKAWVIDQMVRALAGNGYDQIVEEACDGEDGSDTYPWDCGVEPTRIGDGSRSPSSGPHRVSGRGSAWPRPARTTNVVAIAGDFPAERRPRRARKGSKLD